MEEDSKDSKDSKEDYSTKQIYEHFQQNQILLGSIELILKLHRRVKTLEAQVAFLKREQNSLNAIL